MPDADSAESAGGGRNTSELRAGNVARPTSRGLPDIEENTSTVLAAMSKCLAESNKSLDGGNATKKREIRQPGLIRQSAF